jgi:RNA polymerase sigma factor (sigma-70 family)
MTGPHDFEQLVIRCQAAVCAVAYSVLRDRARSEEVAQEAFLIAWRKLPAMSPPPKLPGWVCGIARNLAVNASRRRKETAMPTEPATFTTPLDTILDREADDLARRALASLSDQDRDVVVMYYRGDGSIADVAASLGISEPAARKRLQRGRERLKTALASVETTLRTTRPGPAFTAACVTAIAAATGVTRADADTPAGQATTAVPSAKWLALIAVPVIVGGAYALHAATSSSDTIAATASSVPTGSPDRADVTTAIPTVRSIDREQRAAVRSRIEAARSSRGAVPIGAVPEKVYDLSGGALADLRPLAKPPEGPLSKSTLRYAIHEVQPMLLECYTAAAGRLTRTEGTITAQIVLIGEPEVPTLVDSVELSGDAHLLADTELVECMLETMMTLELSAMPEPGKWRVHYPFVVGARN